MLKSWRRRKIQQQRPSQGTESHLPDWLGGEAGSPRNHLLNTVSLGSTIVSPSESFRMSEKHLPQKSLSSIKRCSKMVALESISTPQIRHRLFSACLSISLTSSNSIIYWPSPFYIDMSYKGEAFLLVLLSLKEKSLECPDSCLGCLQARLLLPSLFACQY